MFSRYPYSDTKLVNVTLHRTVYSQQYTKQTPYYVPLSAAVDFKYRRTTRKSFKSAIHSSYILPVASNQTFTAQTKPLHLSFCKSKLITDTLKAFDDFKSKQKSVWNNVFLICKSIYIWKDYSIYYTLRQKQMLKNFLQTK